MASPSMALCNAMSLSNEVVAARRHLPWHCLLKSVSFFLLTSVTKKHSIDN